MPWKQALDRAYSLAQIEALDSDAIIAELEAETPPAKSLSEIEARDTALRAALEAFDAITIRAMKVRLDHALANDGSIAPATRNVLVQTIINYDDKIGVLEERVRDLATRGGAPDPEAVTDLVMGAAHKALALRDRLRRAVLNIICRFGEDDVPHAFKQARDPKLDDRTRTRWSAVVRDFETLAETPSSIMAAPWATRIAAWPDQLLEPEAPPEPSLADLIEID